MNFAEFIFPINDVIFSSQSNNSMRLFYLHHHQHFQNYKDYPNYQDLKLCFLQKIWFPHYHHYISNYITTLYSILLKNTMVLFFSQKAMKLPPRVCQSPQILWIFENMAERRVSHTHSAKYILPNTKNTFLSVFLTFKFFENIMRKVSFLEMSQKIILIKGSVNVREVGGFSFPRVAPCDINGASLQELSRTGETGLNFLYSAASQLQMCLLKGVHLAWTENHEVASALQYILRISLCTLLFVFLACFD